MPSSFSRVPPEIRRIVEAERWRDRAWVDPNLAAALAAVKPGLDFVRVRLDISPEILPPGAVSGRWHVRDREARPVAHFYPIATESGGYREPDSGVIREMRAMDMRRRDVAERVFSQGTHAEEKKARSTALRKEQERDELKSDLKAGWRVKGRIYRDDGSLVKRKRA